jgi:hypothetical protein
MAQYTGIQGSNILIVSSDPENPVEGQIWYNTTSNLLKGYETLNVWSSGGNLPSARAYMGGAGTQTAGLAFGGQGAPLGTTSAYNGTAWTNLPGNMTTIRDNMGAAGATQTAALTFGGYTPSPAGATTASESWNGTSWTSTPSLNTARYGVTGFGIQTAALAIGGGNATGTLSAVDSWNGSSWTSSTSLPAVLAYAGSAGIQTAGIVFGGESTGSPTIIATSRSWNGSAWSPSPSLNTARNSLSGAGIQTLALAFGGSAPSLSAATELWNGSIWTSNPTGLGTARNYIARGTGLTQTAALAVGGTASPGNTAATEEWTGLGVQTITVS